MKYDCSKIIDYSHEVRRMCKIYAECETCPLIILDIECTSVDDVTQEVIDILQKWSDEHPEQPKLSREERDFLDCFYDNQGMAIRRTEDNRLYVVQHGGTYEECLRIDEDMFPCVHNANEWYFDKLLGLEVSDD